ncbi:hypothetical protein BU23DRAFT_301559 [Bimuria novae-zelandiae CBS 107.79]|uniref:Uncharacterized protein n=1 Tax=Bimuria novae-zelandiae CBS 107.79 TaxID=1447943 RepID=A0A6A5UPX5_9PLEO|nr:hypothetical protein BU23DRAFT_301559 [Bimuria novae-zelandiae CBS 107.79]
MATTTLRPHNTADETIQILLPERLCIPLLPCIRDTLVTKVAHTSRTAPPTSAIPPVSPLPIHLPNPTRFRHSQFPPSPHILSFLTPPPAAKHSASLVASSACSRLGQGFACFACACPANRRHTRHVCGTPWHTVTTWL